MKKIKMIMSNLLTHYRHFLYTNSYLHFLMRDHIGEQITFRLRFMDQSCSMGGSCNLCQHENHIKATPLLQCNNGACHKPCYPHLMSRAKWKEFIQGTLIFNDENGLWEYYPPTEMMIGGATTMTKEQLHHTTKTHKYGKFITTIFHPNITK